jgi:hypothetical protein
VVTSQQTVDNVINVGGYVGRTRGDKCVFVEEHLPLTVVVTLVLISDMSNDGTPNEVMNALDEAVIFFFRV